PRVRCRPGRSRGGKLPGRASLRAGPSRAQLSGAGGADVWHLEADPFHRRARLEAPLGPGRVDKQRIEDQAVPVLAQFLPLRPGEPVPGGLVGRWGGVEVLLEGEAPLLEGAVQELRRVTDDDVAREAERQMVLLTAAPHRSFAAVGEQVVADEVVA